MRKFIISVLFGLVFSMILMAYADETQKSVASNVMRLHIIANSDNAYDQMVKLLVRDAIIDEFSSLVSDAKNPTHARQIIEANLLKAEAIAQRVLDENNFSYYARAVCTKSHFPIKKYGTITLPPGEYDALKIILGNGAGQNWWCVMYPPLCFEDAIDMGFDSNSKKILKESLGETDFALISDTGSIPVCFKFKLLEIFDAIRK